MTRIDLPDPTTYLDRACRGVPQDVFFPETNRKRDIDRARSVCGACPRLAACAEWALPKAVTGELSSCVIAAVALPSDRAGQKRKDAALDELAAIAALLPGARAGQKYKDAAIAASASLPSVEEAA